MVSEAWNSRVGRWAIRLVALAFSLFHIWTSGPAGLLPDFQQRAVLVLFGLILTFAMVSVRKQHREGQPVPIYDVALIGLVIVTTVYAIFSYKRFVMEWMVSTPVDLVFGVIITLLALEAARRSVGVLFPSLAAVMVLYAYAGPLFPGLLHHPGLKPYIILNTLYQTTDGVFGLLTGVVATVVAIFIIFGAVLLFSGGGQVFVDMALKVAGKMRGGPALVAVIASSLFGTISGAAVANVATTGNFTIPLMKRLGYRPEFAAAVEATASTGGMIMPPIMGAGAFIMAELLSIPYIKIAIAAAIPAILYYVAIFIGVRLEAERLHLAPVPDAEIPPAKSFLSWSKLAPLVIPVVTLLYFLLHGYSAGYSVFWSLMVSIVLFLFSSFKPSQIKERVIMLENGLERGAKALAEIVPLIICANIVVSMVNLTGLGVKLTSMIIALAGAHLVLALILAAIVVMILGMGLPTVAAYVLAGAVAGPALQKLGIEPLLAHMFLFYYSCLAAITPPVCIAAMTGAAIAKADWMKTAFICLKLAAVAYFLPFAFVYSKTLLAIGPIPEIALSFITATLGTLVLAVFFWGYPKIKLNVLSRALMLPAAGLLLTPGWQTDLIGIGIVALAIAAQYISSSMLKRRAAET